MVDDLSRFHGLTRPQLMSRIRSRGNKKTEIALLKILREQKFTGWRRHAKLPGKPDFAFPRLKVAIFVDGCFWHGCPRHYKPPTTRGAFWEQKILTNRKRDRRVSRELRAKGWQVVRIWECALVGTRRPATIQRLQRYLAPCPADAGDLPPAQHH
ncbi:very short patch repair endonuclease [Terrimicrobium sacchariphilum]|uniref:very short patch repair endonuclease n=1 Tax=Terrimicrobium sacchariphilum TaxID=690879 RepID=UPI00094669D9